MHDTYETPLGTRYAGKQMQQLFSADTRYQTWRKLWVELARAQCELGLPVTPEQVAELEAHITDIDYEAERAKEKEIRHDVMAHIYAYGLVCPNAKGIIHLGATSCYVTDNADLIIYGIGSVYTSVLPNVIIPEVREALQQSDAYKIYFCNAMTQPGETDGYSMEDHVRALKDHGAPVDAVLYADDSMPPAIIENYQREESIPVIIRESEHPYKVIKKKLLSFEGGLVRHASGLIESAVRELVEERRCHLLQK